MKIKLIAISVCLLAAVACQDDDFDTKFSPAYPAAGEWYVHEYYEGDDTAYGPYHLQVYNTSFSEDSVWVSNIYGDGVVVKARVNTDKSFNVSDVDDLSGGYGKVSILNSKIVDTDSIYFEVILYDTEGDLEGEFTIAGRRWTGLEGE